MAFYSLSQIFIIDLLVSITFVDYEFYLYVNIPIIDDLIRFINIVIEDNNKIVMKINHVNYY